MRLLYVEDNRINALLFEEALKLQQGFELRVAEDGAQAMEIVVQWLPEVLVLDSHLPDINGAELLGRLRTVPSMARVPAFMCSADAQPEDLQQAADAGFAGYWTKPISIEAVLDDLRRVQSSSN
jgi:CheY-like chemotaxis protein